MVRAATASKFQASTLAVADVGLFTNDEDVILTADLAAGAGVTAATVDDTSGVAVGMFLAVRGLNGLEVVRITAVGSATTLTVARAQDGTSAVAHYAGEQGKATMPALALNQLRDDVIAIETFLGAGSMFTQGSVIFAGPAGSLTQDNAHFNWDDANSILKTGAVRPWADNAYDLGTTSLRFKGLYLGPASLHILNNAGDANDLATLGSGGLRFGAGGASALDLTFKRTVEASGLAVWDANGGPVTNHEPKGSYDVLVYKSGATYYARLNTGAILSANATLDTVLAAAVAQVVTGGTIRLNIGAASLTSAAWTITPNASKRVTIVGNGAGITNITQTVAGANGITIGDGCLVDLKGFTITMPAAGATGHGIACGSTNNIGLQHSTIEDVEVYNGDATHYGVYLVNPFFLKVRGLRVNYAINGVYLLQDHATNNCGNSVFTAISITGSQTPGFGIVNGLLVEALNGTMNLNQFDLLAIEAYGTTSSIGLYLKGSTCSYNSFYRTDIEDVDYGVIVEGTGNSLYGGLVRARGETAAVWVKSTARNTVMDGFDVGAISGVAGLVGIKDDVTTVGGATRFSNVRVNSGGASSYATLVSTVNATQLLGVLDSAGSANTNRLGANLDLQNNQVLFGPGIATGTQDTRIKRESAGLLSVRNSTDTAYANFRGAAIQASSGFAAVGGFSPVIQGRDNNGALVTLATLTIGIDGANPGPWFDMNFNFRLKTSPIAGTDNTYDFGTATSRFRTMYLGTSLELYGASADANPILKASSSGIAFGAGGATATDVTVLRQAANILEVTAGVAGDVRAGMSGAGTAFISGRKAAADANSSFHVDTGGVISFGPGGATARDTTWTRQAASVMEFTGSLAGSVREGMSGAGTPFVALRTAAADANAVAQILTDRISFGAGGASAVDYSLTRTGANTGTLTGTLAPSADNSYDLGTSALRWRSVYATGSSYYVHAAASDAQPSTKLGSAVLGFGAGGATALDAYIFRQAANVLAASTDGATIDGTLYAKTFKIKNQGAGSDPTLTCSSGAANILLSGGLIISATLLPSADAGAAIGSSATRFTTTNVSSQFNLWNAASDANPLIRISTAGLLMGAGGATATDNAFARQAASVLEHTGSLAGSVRHGMSGAGTPFLALRAAAADANAIAQILTDRISFGAGGASAVDISLSRSAANEFTLTASSGVKFTGDLLPSADNARALGSAAVRMAHVYAASLDLLSAASGSVGSLVPASLTGARTWTHQDLTGIISQSGGTYTMAGAAPAFAALVTVPSTVGSGRVFGSVQLTATVTNAATINIQVETGVGTGVYTTVQTMETAAGLTTRLTDTYAVMVPPGRRFKFTQGALAGTTETISLYSYAET